MSLSRRKFLQQTALTAAGSAFLTRGLMAAMPSGNALKELTGVQLYSVRDEMKKDPMGTLQALSKMGYKHVEHANYVNRKFYGWTAKEFKKVLDGLGLNMPSGHTVMTADHWDTGKKDFTDAWKYTVEDAATCGQKFVISPWLQEDKRKNESDLKGFLEIFNKCGELCQKSGMKYGYHNHDFEFSQKLGDRTVFDIILSETEPKLVMQQLDIGNMINGGAKALDIMKKYPGRFESMHVKDEIASSSADEKFESTVLGKGIVPVKEVIDLGRKWGTKHFIIEQESYQGQPPLESVKEDLAIMKKWGY